MDWQDLEQRMAALRMPEATPSPALLQDLERKLTAGLVPVTPLRPAGEIAAVWGVIFALVVWAGVAKLRPMALPILGTGTAILLLGVLVMGAIALMLSMARQMAPGSRYRIPPAVLPAAVLGGVAVLFAAVYPAQAAAGWPPGRKCLEVGLAVGLVTGGLFWLVLRRGAFLHPRLAGATAGLAAGLAGTTVLTIHCPIVEAPHVILWHLGAAALCALLGMAILPKRFRDS